MIYIREQFLKAVSILLRIVIDYKKTFFVPEKPQNWHKSEIF